MRPDGARWNDLGGATASEHTTPATALADTGTGFHCIVTNGVGSDTSADALLTVTDPPAVDSGSSDDGGGCSLGAGGVALLAALSWLGFRLRRRA